MNESLVGNVHINECLVQQYSTCRPRAACDPLDLFEWPGHGQCTNKFNYLRTRTCRKFPHRSMLDVLPSCTLTKTSLGSGRWFCTMELLLLCIDYAFVSRTANLRSLGSTAAFPECPKSPNSNVLECHY
ncbi:hypothetical protein TNCV_4831691 [Trichonephila clavipes]|nr:hypothetical protein TNCV_4831691 [Trichonephila clavipes]